MCISTVVARILSLKTGNFFSLHMHRYALLPFKFIGQHLPRGNGILYSNCIVSLLQKLFCMVFAQPLLRVYICLYFFIVGGGVFVCFCCALFSFSSLTWTSSVALPDFCCFLLLCSMCLDSKCGTRSYCHLEIYILVFYFSFSALMFSPLTLVVRIVCSFGGLCKSKLAVTVRLQLYCIQQN